MDGEALLRGGIRARGGSALWTSPETAGVLLRTEAFGPTYSLVAESSPFDLRGGAAILKYELASAGSAGSSAPLPSLSTLFETVAVGYTLTAEAGSFALEGQAAGLAATRTLPLAAGAFSASGQDVALKAGRRLAADAEVFALAGQDVALVKPGAYSLACGAGAFSLTGQDAGLTKGTSASDVPVGGGAMWSLPPVRKRRVEPEWDEESDDAGVLVAVGIL